MDSHHKSLTTGLKGLDRVLKGIIAGDNIVWQVESIDDYFAFVVPYCEAARKNGRKLVYFRFADHAPLLPPDFGADVHELHPEEGFETFIAQIHGVIEDAGRGAFYVFDCLSSLIVDWYSDQMLANFFMLTCPYLYDLETVTYFGLLRNNHSSHATQPILRTTQLFLDVYRDGSDLYIRPRKVQHRYSPTIDMLHVWAGDEFVPVSNSTIIARIQTRTWAGLNADISIGPWERSFLRGREACDAVARGEAAPEDEQAVFTRLVRMVISRDEAMLRLIGRYFTLSDVLEVQKRIIGTGLIGGKTVGMLLARAILRKECRRVHDVLEPHDSFYVGSDVFYTFLVRNGVWWMRQKQRDAETFLTDAGLARQRILAGQFPDYVLKQFSEMLDYFGQSPIVVRSSSLLEDNFGNSFAGKYTSVFCANQGPKEQRLEDFLAAVRTIYASTMSTEALRYRERRKLLELDEQMALLVMRVSGSRYGNFFYPQAAGVGFSFNPYAWSEYIDPRAGVLRLVFGLGTRAVDRSDDDYTRIVALNAPQRRPEANFLETREYSQRSVDYLDLTANQVVSGYFNTVVENSPGVPVGMFATPDNTGAARGAPKSLVLTFDRLLSSTAFVDDMRQMLQVLQKAYDYPVDIEFTLNLLRDESYGINLVQCRPLPVQGTETVKLSRPSIRDDQRIIEARGAVIGQSRVVEVKFFIYVVPSRYAELPQNDRYQVARIIGQVNKAYAAAAGAAGTAGVIMLLGPGRWGTSSPSLGVPVTFTEINHVALVCEIVAMHKDLVPDASLGTHFLNELVEMDMLYMALYPQQAGNYLDAGFFEQAPNCLDDLVPEASGWGHVVRAIRAHDAVPPSETIVVSASAFDQNVVCYRSGGPDRSPLTAKRTVDDASP